MAGGSRAAGIFLSVIFILLVAGCSKSSDEERISQIIDKLSQAIATNKPATVVEYLHEDFHANSGAMNAQQVKQLLMMYSLQHQSISVTILSSKTIIDPVYKDKAESTLSVATTASSGGILPEDGGVRVVRLEWRKDGDWKILKADWQ
jgi:hypothetical protein